MLGNENAYLAANLTWMVSFATFWALVIRDFARIFARHKQMLAERRVLNEELDKKLEKLRSCNLRAPEEKCEE